MRPGWWLLLECVSEYRPNGASRRKVISSAGCVFAAGHVLEWQFRKSKKETVGQKQWGRNGQGEGGVPGLNKTVCNSVRIACLYLLTSDATAV